MARYYGTIGFGMPVERAPGVEVLQTIEKPYYGDVIDDTRRWEQGEQLNDDLNITNKISIIADSFATQNCGAMRYATFIGVKWKIKSVTVAYPRLILNLGGVYNDQDYETSEDEACGTSEET